jgi:hypothetical protein
MQAVLKFSSRRPIVSRSQKLLLKAVEPSRPGKLLRRTFCPFPTPISALKVQDPTGFRVLPFPFIRMSFRRLVQSF